MADLKHFKKKAKGKVQEEKGKLEQHSRDTGTKLHGFYDEAAGKIRQGVADMESSFDETRDAEYNYGNDDDIE